MALTLTADPLPLTVDAEGRIRVGGTRVFLNILVNAFNVHGWSAEELARQYDTVKLEDIYATLAFYLRHKDEVDAYVRECDEQGERIRAQIEKHLPPRLTRDELLARFAQQHEASAHDSAAHR